MREIETTPRPLPEWAASALAAEFEPLPRIGILAALRRYWLLALLPVLVLVPVVGIVAAKRAPKYSAEARLMVGRLNMSTAGAVAGFAQAAQDLASTYPLVIYSDGVVARVAHQLHISEATVRSDLTATSVPGSSIVRIDATAGSAGMATQLANAGSRALVSYLASLDRTDPDAARLHRRLMTANLAYEHAAALVPAPSSRPLDANGQRLKANAETARTEVAALTSAYQQALLDESTSSLLQPVSYAAGATSDKTSKLEIAVLAALIAGAVLGLAFATLRANFVARRALAAPSWEPVAAVLDGNGVSPAGKQRPLRSLTRRRSSSRRPDSG